MQHGLDGPGLNPDSSRLQQSPLHVESQSEAEKYGKNGRIDGRIARIDLHHPPEMQNGQHRHHIDQPVQLGPAVLQDLDHLGCRGHGQWNQQDKGNESHGNEGSIDDIPDDLGKIEKLVQSDVQR